MVIVTCKILTEAKQHTNDILERFYKYFTLNRLSINPSKTKYIIYKPKLRLQKKNYLVQDAENIDIVMNKTILNQVQSIKFFRA